MIKNKAFTHFGERNMVEPSSMWDTGLTGKWHHPFWEAVIILLCGFDLPAHDEKHHVKHCNALRESRDVRKSGEDIGEDFG